MLLLLELDLSGCAHLDDSDTAGQLGETFLQLLAIPVRVGVLDLRLDLGHTTFDVGGRAGAFDDGGVVLGDDDLASRAEQAHVGRVELQANLFGDDLTTGEDGHVLQHCLPTLTKARGLDGHGVEGATDLVHHEGGKGFALDVLGDDQQGLARLHDLLEHGQEVLYVRDLALVEQDVRIVEHGFLALGVGDEVRRQVALVELHALDEVEIHAERVGLLDGDHTVLADLVDRVGDGLADRGVGRRDRSDLGDLVLGVVDLHRLTGEVLDGGGNGLLHALLDTHRVGTRGNVAQTLANERLGEHGGSGGAVAGDVVGLGRNFLDQLGTHVLELVFQLDLTGDGDTVVGDRGSAELLVEHHVATLRAEGHLDGVSELVDARLEAATGLFVELENLGHGSSVSRSSRARRER